ncbi:MAG: translation initiation factor IF-2 N-terminal domain-containing protein, partial [Campylobacterota bacterium]|nr:translation initiation factor IF-2 N-terminal domain-containing protein [Campylobacterota bacterium]
MKDNIVRVYEVAEEAGATSTTVIEKAAELSIMLKSPQSTMSDEDAESITTYIMTGKSDLLKEKKDNTKDNKKTEAKVKTPKKEESVKKTPENKKAPVKKTEVKDIIKRRKELTIVQKKNPKKEEPIVEKVKEKVIVEEVKKDEPSIKKEEMVKDKAKVDTTITPNKDTSALVKEKDVKKEEVKPKMVLKKRGLTIVKKKRPQIEVTQNVPQSKKKKMASMSDLFGAGNELKEQYTTSKQKKTKTKQAAKGHAQGKKLKVDTVNDFKEPSESIMGEEVVLLDMGLMETSKFLRETPKPKNIRTTKPSAFGNIPRGIKRKSKKKTYKTKVEEVDITEVTIPEECRVYEFAEKINKSAGDVIGKLFMLGMMVTKNDFLGKDELEILGEEYNIEITVKDELEDVNYVEDYAETEIDKTNFVSRPPVVTIMGHVDHGKTSLLDKIRSSRIASGEAGGITQHIGAYTVSKNGQDITFVDTPGHEAFSAMRVRGASVTDIIIIVVAADDGVKPQTIESIKAAKDSGAPIIVAVNKIDKETANIDMVKAGMAEHDMSPADWGGDIEFIGVSALTGDGIDDLLENIIIQSELLELQADPTSLAKATVIESSQVKGKGAV